MRLGVQMYTLRTVVPDEAGVREAAEKLRGMGYTCVQCFKPDSVSDERFQAIMDEYGLKNETAFADYAVMREKGIAGAVRQARLYRSNLIAIDTIPQEMRKSSEGFKQYADGLNELGHALRKEGLRLTYHNHALEFLSLGKGVTGMDILADQTDHDCVFFTLDTHWLAAAGVNPVDWIHRVRGRMPLIHFKDYAIVYGVGEVEEVFRIPTDVGEGNLNWKAIIDACAQTGVEACIVELDDCEDPYESLRVSKQNLDRFGL